MTKRKKPLTSEEELKVREGMREKLRKVMEEIKERELRGTQDTSENETESENE